MAVSLLSEINPAIEVELSQELKENVPVHKTEAGIEDEE
jgi:hypothetical protein